MPENLEPVDFTRLAPAPGKRMAVVGSCGGTGREPIEDWFHSRAMGDDIKKTIPLGRIAVPDDVVGPILFLAGDAARFMTGQVLYINGGRLMP